MRICHKYAPFAGMGGGGTYCGGFSTFSLVVTSPKYESQDKSASIKPSNQYNVQMKVHNDNVIHGSR